MLKKTLEVKKITKILCGNCRLKTPTKYLPIKKRRISLKNAAKIFARVPSLALILHCKNFSTPQG